MPFKPPVIGASRLEDDENVLLLSQPVAQLPETFRRIGQAARLRPGMPECIKTVFRHVNADGILGHLFFLPMLVVRARSPRICSGR